MKPLLQAPLETVLRIGAASVLLGWWAGDIRVAVAAWIILRLMVPDEG